MRKISSGVKDLDRLLDSLHEGDNVVWEVEAGTSVDVFVKNFILQSLSEGMDVVYISFNKSPQSVLKRLGDIAHHKKFTLLDSFTSGKGKNDRTFHKFYEAGSSQIAQVIRVDRPSDIDSFTDMLNSLQDRTPPSARYVFDSITGMQDLWDDEHSTYKFFTYMCPRLYDLDTVAYWILEKDAHSQTFKANLRHITQVVVDLYKRGENIFFKTVKLENRVNRESFKPHRYVTDGLNISIKSAKKEPPFKVGARIREHRLKIGLSQKELADKVSLTPSFISQMENSQISPSLNSFLQICGALGISPVEIWQEKLTDDAEWFIAKEQVLASLEKKLNGISVYHIVRGERLSSYITVISPHSSLEGHFLYHKGEELIHILKGNVHVVINGHEKELNTGDTLFLTDTFPSEWKNRGDEPAELFISCS